MTDDTLLIRNNESSKRENALSISQVQKILQGLSHWTASVNFDKISRTIECQNFAHALELLMKIGDLAQKANHHPDLLLHNYKYLTVTLSTHSAQGLTQKDFDLAAQINEINK